MSKYKKKKQKKNKKCPTLFFSWKSFAPIYFYIYVEVLLKQCLNMLHYAYSCYIFCLRWFNQFSGHISAVGSPNRLSDHQFLRKWPTTNPTWLLNHWWEKKSSIHSISMINFQGEITPGWRIEPETSGLQIWCSNYWATINLSTT